MASSRLGRWKLSDGFWYGALTLGVAFAWFSGSGFVSDSRGLHAQEDVSQVAEDNSRGPKEFSPYTAMMMRTVEESGRWSMMGAGELVDVVAELDGGYVVIDEFGYRGLVSADDIADLSTALVAHQKTLDQNANDRDALFRCQIILQEMSHYKEAVELSSRLVKEHPGFINGWVSRSNLFLVIGRFDDSVQAATLGLERSPDAESLLINRGLAYRNLEKNDLAIADFGRAIEKHDSIMGLGKRANVYLDEGFYEKALADYDRAIQANRVDFLLRGRADVHQAMENDAKAEADLDAAVEINPANYLNFLNRGRFHFARGTMEKASRDLAKSVSMRPNHPEALCDYGAVLAQMDQYEQANEMLQRSNDVEPNNALTLGNLAFVLHRLGRSEEGLEAADAAIKKDVDSALAHFNRATILSDTGKYAESLSSFDRAIELKPDATNYRNNRGVTQRLAGNLDSAESDFRYLVELDAKDALAWSNLGRVEIDREDYEKAIELLSRAIELDPEEPIFFDLRAQARTKVQQLDAALDDRIRITELTPKDVQAWLDLGGDYLMLEDNFDQAIIAYSKALELDPDNTVAWNNRSYSHLNSEDYEAAAADARRVLELVPSDDDATHNLAISLYNMDMYPEAAYHYSVLIGMGLSTNKIRSQRGDCFLSMNRYDEAEADYTAVLLNEPNDAAVLHARAVVRAMTDQVADAIADFDAAIEANPERVRTHLLRARLLRAQQEYKASVEGFRDVVELEPRSADYAVELACLLAAAPDQSLRKPSEAARLVDNAMQSVNSPSPTMWAAKSLVHGCQNEFEQAIAAAERSLQVSQTLGVAPLEWVPQALEQFRAGREFRFPGGDEGSNG